MSPDTIHTTITTALGIEVHFVDAAGSPAGGVYTAYRVKPKRERLERDGDHEVFSVVLELASSSEEIEAPIVDGLDRDTARRLTHYIAAAIRDRVPVDKEFIAASIVAIQGAF